MYDLLIQGGRIADGSGNPSFSADIGIEGDTIVEIGRLNGAQSRRRLDAQGLVVCPGFIDIHSHSDVLWMTQPDAFPKLSQGVTTELTGQDGISYAPVSAGNMAFWREYLAGVNGNFDMDWGWSSVSDYLDRLDRKISVNIAYLLPHGALRHEVMGLESRTATPEELARMALLVEQGMAEGAFGLSTGLYYLPAIYADTRELIEICRPVARRDGLFASHMRDYGQRISEAFEEMCQVSQEAGVRTHISHFNTSETTGSALIGEARRRGIDMTYDTYPYLAGCTLLGCTLPLWVQEGTVSEAVDRMRRPESRERLNAESQDNRGSLTSYLEHIIIAGVFSAGNKRFEGLSVPAAAQAAGTSLGDFIADLLVEERFAVTIVAHHTNRTEEDMIALMRRREQIVGSDGVMIGGHPHPRGYGTYPRILGHYVREKSALELEEAIRKMTWAPASRIGLKGRGLLVEGWKADITCFDPETVIDRSTYEQGNLPPEGISSVIVNGRLVIDRGQHTGEHPGRALRKGHCD